MEQIDMNEYFLKQASLLDPSWLVWLQSVTEFIINCPYNLFLLQVVSYNINKSLQAEIKDKTDDLYRLYAWALNELNNNWFKDFIQCTPEKYFKYFNNNLLRFTSNKVTEKINLINNQINND